MMWRRTKRRLANPPSSETASTSSVKTCAVPANDGKISPACAMPVTSINPPSEKIDAIFALEASERCMNQALIPLSSCCSAVSAISIAAISRARSSAMIELCAFIPKHPP